MYIIEASIAFLLAASGANAFCADFSVLPLITCTYADGGNPNNTFDCHSTGFWKTGVEAAAAYRISPTIFGQEANSTSTNGLSQVQKRDTCNGTPFNTTEGIKITQPRLANITLDEDDEEQLFQMASKATNTDFVSNLNYTTEQSAACFSNGTNGFIAFQPTYTCVELMLLNCAGSSVVDGTIVRACTPEEGQFSGELGGSLQTLTPLPADVASSYLGPAPTTMEPLSVTTTRTISQVGYSYTVFNTAFVTPLPSSYTTQIPSYSLTSKIPGH